MLVIVVLTMTKMPFVMLLLLLQIRAQHGVCGRNWPHRLWWGAGGVDSVWGACEGPSWDGSGEGENMRRRRKISGSRWIRRRRWSRRRRRRWSKRRRRRRRRRWRRRIRRALLASGILPPWTVLWLLSLSCLVILQYWVDSLVRLLLLPSFVARLYTAIAKTSFVTRLFTKCQASIVGLHAA